VRHPAPWLSVAQLWSGVHSSSPRHSSHASLRVRLGASGWLAKRIVALAKLTEGIASQWYF
ncbi:MAG: hypothetical protein KME33_34625, partial [Aetokthonos hydrillicola CCALA 1050]|uniref:hypothetical protein n=1 Tax=Aetokthonos hydrillicola TaxID=1550245 RepID=UPI001ABAAD71|nr:hypothetical protein [Aetokthonos hydrillicola CCALA 1050]